MRKVSESSRELRQLTKPVSGTRLGNDMGLLPLWCCKRDRTSVLLTFAPELNCSRLKYSSLV